MQVTSFRITTLRVAGNVESFEVITAVQKSRAQSRHTRLTVLAVRKSECGPKGYLKFLARPLAATKYLPHNGQRMQEWIMC